jgi:hypothetical protein
MAIQRPAIVLQVAIGLVLPVLASLVPFLAGLRVSASEAMNAYALGIRRIGAGWFGEVISGQPVVSARPSGTRRLAVGP